MSSWSESRAEGMTEAMFSEGQEEERESSGEEGVDVDASVFVKVSHNKSPSQTCHNSRLTSMTAPGTHPTRPFLCSADGNVL